MGEPFRHRLRVRYHECDPQGVVFNANYLAYFDIALIERDGTVIATGDLRHVLIELASGEKTPIPGRAEKVVGAPIHSVYAISLYCDRR
jgi:acyl-CoA thioesterase FadM